MKAIAIKKPGVIGLISRNKPEAGTGEILLKIKYVGFCGSDLSTYLGKNPLVSYPRIPGHEISAVIEEVGEEVPEHFEPGKKATVVPYTNCGYCSSCKQKRYNACRYNQTLGVQRDGAMAEYLIVPWEKVIIVETLPEGQLALIEPLTVGFHAINNGEVTDIDTVMVLGCGMIGAGAVIRAALRGATVIAVDVDDRKLGLAKSLGAMHVINSKKQALHAELDKITGGHGSSVVVEAAGNPATYKSAIEEVAFAGRVVCIGYTNSDVAFQTKLWVQKELKIMGSRNASHADFEAVIKYLEKNKPDENLLISRVVTPEQVPEAIKFWSENTGEILKILVQF